ncbi:hypothetical protein BG841_05310 [Marinobacter sp. X15-166B]|nr:hypothetical protein BG841_05310 [Marinobacter sp. X15-166B]
MITLPQLTEVLGWASLINLAYLLLATVTVVFMRESLAAVHSRLFAIDRAQLPAAYFRYLGHYKIVTLVFMVAPYLALKIMGH